MEAIKQAGEGIDASCLQEVLDSARNATAKGMSQFFTPLTLAKVLSSVLPANRSTVVDLNAGAGHLLIGSANETTWNGLMADIQPSRTMPHDWKNLTANRITSDLTLLYEMLVEVRWNADLLVLNPPWDCHWYRDRLKSLADSTLVNVSKAFQQIDPRLGKELIDSTVATMMIALDRMSHRGEGLLIANNATLERLIFSLDAPYRHLADHVWARVVINGNPMTGISGCNWQKETQFQTGVLYFAHSHWGGCQHTVRDVKDLEELSASLSRISRIRCRRGQEVCHKYNCESGTVSLWDAVRDEVRSRSSQRKHDKYNIWLDGNGEIRTNLSLFENYSIKIDKAAAKALNELNGKNPMQLVMQSGQRQELQRAVFGTIWRVDPQLPKLVEEAISQYHGVRAPLYELTKIQSLGFLDEENSIIPERPFQKNGGSWKAGKAYPLRTKTVVVERKAFKPGMDGEDQELLLNGQDLAIYIKDESGKEFCFMDQRHSGEGVQVDKQAPKENMLSLQDLADNFHIPTVPDVSASRRGEYEANKNQMAAIEAALAELAKAGRVESALRFKRFQLEDYSRGAVHDGLILAHDTGLGKTIATFSFPLIWCGFDTSPEGLTPKEPVLIVAPGDLHRQICDEGRARFGVDVVALDSQTTYLRLAPLKPGFYITSFTQLASNGVIKVPEDWDQYAHLCAKLGYKPGEPFYQVSLFPSKPGQRIIDCLAVPSTHDPTKLKVGERYGEDYTITNVWKHPPQGQCDGVGVQKNGVACTFSPSLADLCCKAFGCVVVDEAVRMKGATSIIGMGVRQMAPKRCLVLTATPIKNRLPDIFWLAWWATGGKSEAHARFPYEGTIEAQQECSEEFLVCERNLTMERAQNGGKVKKSRGRGKVTAEVCNIHRLWKFLAPIVLRRRKKDIGEDIVKKLRQPIRVPMGTAQAKVVKYHLAANYLDKNLKPAIGPKLQALRSAAAAPHSELLHAVPNGPER